MMLAFLSDIGKDCVWFLHQDSQDIPSEPVIRISIWYRTAFRNYGEGYRLV